MEEDDKAIIGQLGGFALEHFLGSFTGEQGISSSSLSAVGLSGGAASTSKGNASSSRAVDVSQIYNGRFEDEDDDAGDGMEGEDWEDEVDREINEEDNMQSGQQLLLHQLPSSSAAIPPMPTTQTLMRGEDEDFDDEEDEPGEAHAGQSVLPPQLPPADGSAGLSGFHMPDASEIMHVKQEEHDGDGMMHGGNEPLLKIEEDEDDGDDEIDPQELAAQQALFAQSYARMQAQQLQSGQEDGLHGMARDASPPLMDVKTLYPDFAPDKILNFTDIFHPRPRKKVRIDPNIEVCKLL